MRVKLTNMASQSTYYVYRAGLEYEVKITPDGREAVRYYHYDQVGSTVAMTDSAQAITDRFHYDPWGLRSTLHRRQRYPIPICGSIRNTNRPQRLDKYACQIL